MIHLNSFHLEKIDYDRKEHLLYLRHLMESKDLDYLWNLVDKNLKINLNEEKYIVVNEEGYHVGYLNISDLIDGIYGNTVSIYYAIEEKYRGYGYGKKLVTEVRHWLFLEEGIDCVVAQVEPDNVHSNSTLLKAGMEKVMEDDDFITYIGRKNK